MAKNTANNGNTPKALEPIQRATIEEILEHYRDHPQASAMLFNYYNNAPDCHEQDAIFGQIMTLADYYRDRPLPLALLQDWVENDIYHGIRQAAVEAIGKYHHDDPQTYSWLCDRALNSEDGNVRQAAVDAIGKYYQDNPQTYSWLRDRVQNSEDGYVRFAAVYTLGDYYQNQPQTLTLLCDRHQNDDDSTIQKEALEQIIEHYPDDPQTLSLLQSCVQSDREGLIMIAASALAEHYTDEPQTLPLLLKVIQTNCDSSQRSSYRHILTLDNLKALALRLVVQYYPNEPQTLPLLLEILQTSKPTDLTTRTTIELLVQNYPYDPQTLCFLQNFAQKFINNEQWVLKYPTNEIKALLKAMVEYHYDDPQTLSLLLQIIQTNRKPEILASAVELLAQHYHNNPQTLVVLHQLKQNQWWESTCTLIEVLVKYYQNDPQTLPFLLDIAHSQEKDDFRRGRALEPLVHHYRNAPSVLPLLQHLAQNEPNSRVRQDALILLACGYRDSSETLPFLKQCIDQYVKEQQDVNYSWILRQIGGCYAGDSQFFSWLKELIQNTQTPGRLRAAFVEVLVDCFLSHSETIELLNNIATHEPDEEARLTAMRGIAKHAEQTKSDRPDESETLPNISIEIPEIPTDCDSDYTKLCKLLKAQLWKQADTETYDLILKKLGRKAGSVIRLEEVLTLSSEDLQTIDQLWTSTSCGHFGFSIQREIYLQCG
ncbi:MAG TPA: hypothetical protein DC064_03235, partial [Cyanobacteria bacterium UBA9273]|nr:hypothetical protein [Cyanobacteria bacterium UBA9273]